MQNLRDTVGEEAEVVQNPIIALGRNRFSESMGPILDSPQATTRALLILRARARRARVVRAMRAVRVRVAGVRVLRRACIPGGGLRSAPLSPPTSDI